MVIPIWVAPLHQSLGRKYGRQTKRRLGYLGTGISLCFYQKFWCHSIVSRNIGRFFVTSLLCDHVQQSRRSRNMVQVLIHPCHLFWMPWHSLQIYHQTLQQVSQTKAFNKTHQHVGSSGGSQNGSVPQNGTPNHPRFDHFSIENLGFGDPPVEETTSQATNPTNPANTNHWLILFMPKLIVIYIYIALSFRQHTNCLQN